MESKLLLSRKESAAALSISLRKLDSLIALKLIAAKKIGSRTLISRRALEIFAERK
jgi:hypothetical protein